MNTRKFDNVNEFNEWRKSNVDGYPLIFEFGEFDEPTMYPCIVVYDTIEQPYTNCSVEDEQYDELREDGYDSDDIEKFIYHYVYPTDFE